VELAWSAIAAIAVAHSILVILYRLFHNRTSYQEKGKIFFKEQERHAKE